ncbi:tetratricopeptide repeat protein [Nostoc sp. LEGE 06077]|uniref:tetratricopeptide repeat protein n=1 Tax=Nostoc sp. LEGE 06077 TaxID=915325 RepID=UPI0018809FA3|nr:tetratricopeptide repeat protein [Nostoc sp. LEGE 06077]MBE9207096.1 tetratricopeptide repeat protein [Nostoc sp. LEGE 06077]
MSSSNKLSNQHNNSELQAEIAKFIAYNQDEFAELVTFIDFAEKFTLGFIEINFPPDIDLLIAGLRQEPQCQSIQFVVLDFPDANLRFLRDELVQQLAKIPQENNKKLVLLIRNLEKSIGVFGDYPPVLQDLNFVRDSYRQTVPHPLLFILPDYAISRLAKFAPDFWAWKSGLFRFKTTESTRDEAIANTLNADTDIERLPTPEQQERIDLLHRLLMEYSPTGETPSLANLRNCYNILMELGKAYLSQFKPIQAREYLEKAGEITKKLSNDSLQRQVIHHLGKSYQQQRQFEKANSYHEQALDIGKKQKNSRAVAISLFSLGNVSLEMRKFHQAQDYYQQTLDIEIESGDRYSCASTYHQLGMVAQELQEFKEARHNYQQALDITIEYGDRYGCASTYHQLGRVAQKLREFEQARRNYQQALDIKIEYGDRYGCASTYFQFGKLAEELGEVEEAKANYLQAVQITAEFNDDYRLEFSLGNLARFYQVTKDESLLAAVSEILGVSVEEVRQSFDEIRNS